MATESNGIVMTTPLLCMENSVQKNEPLVEHYRGDFTMEDSPSYEALKAVFQGQILPSNAQKRPKHRSLISLLTSSNINLSSAGGSSPPISPRRNEASDNNVDTPSFETARRNNSFFNNIPPLLDQNLENPFEPNALFRSETLNHNKSSENDLESSKEPLGPKSSVMSTESTNSRSGMTSTLAPGGHPEVMRSKSIAIGEQKRGDSPDSEMNFSPKGAKQTFVGYPYQPLF